MSSFSDAAVAIRGEKLTALGCQCMRLSFPSCALGASCCLVVMGRSKKRNIIWDYLSDGNHKTWPVPPSLFSPQLVPSFSAVETPSRSLPPHSL